MKYGSSKTYKDENSISNEELKEIQYNSIASSYPLTTLIVFRSKKKNCCNINVDAGERVLVKASFLSRNYDEKESTPVFGLHFDANFWATVNTSSLDVVSHEAIYVVKELFMVQTKPLGLMINMHAYVHIPPQTVLTNAITTSSTLWGIYFVTNLPKKPSSTYVATYYSEVIVLNSTNKRSFQFYIDDKIVSGPILPPFGSTSELVTTNKIASALNNFSQRSTTDSTLPPLLNAMEIYNVTNPLSNGTYNKYVERLAIVTSGFDVLKD
ncbi:hypothetical protein Ddye_008702 [Dipteronia dyeriana]|uniref:Malectin-like domain-containing protein n=1 Tax=Dipteronia dyeriana TaxID=168575 RepID=A0AAD9XA00_9ROSI|nr:hypothetical protein Ddye_008702 [Dipteronia dyeriana]